LSQIEESINSLLTNHDEKAPRVLIGIAKDNILVYEKQFGLANLEYQIPITSETSFHLPSVSKKFTVITKRN